MDLADKYDWQHFAEGQAELKEEYRTFFSICIDEDHELLLATSNSGDLVVWSLDHLDAGDGVARLENAEQNGHRPLFVFKTEAEYPLYRLILDSTHTHLLLATRKGFFGWKWRSLRKMMKEEGKTTAELPAPDISFVREEDNRILAFTDICVCMRRNEEDETGGEADPNEILISSSNGTVYRYNLADSEVIMEYKGHTGSIHSLSAFPDGFISGGEDGALIIWDYNSPESLDRLEPSVAACGHKSAVTCTSISYGSQWLAVGCAAGFICKYHMPSRTFMAILPTVGYPLTCNFDDLNIVVAGVDPFISYWNVKGERILNLRTDLECIYDVKRIQTTRFDGVHFLAGSPGEISVFLGFNRTNTKFTM